MCGRFAATASVDELVREYDIDEVADLGPAGRPRWNVAPTQPIATVVSRDGEGAAGRVLVAGRFGLIPPWAKERPMQLINARVETVAEKPSFRAAIRRRRCIVPALGYYEWRAEGRHRQPYFLRPGSGTLAMAGIFESHRLGDEWVRTVALLTTAATDDTGWVHDRMPLTVPAHARAAWLDPEARSAGEALALCEEPALRRPVAVSRAVGNVANDGPQLLAPIGE